MSHAPENGATPLSHDDDAPTAVTGRRMVRGSTWALTSAFLPQAFSFVTSIAIARVLGVDGVGRVAFIGFVSSTLVTLLILGLPPALVRFVGEELGAGRPARVRGLVGVVWRLLLVPALAGFLTMAAIGAFGGEPAAAWVLGGVATGGAVLHSLPAAFLVGAQRWREAHITGITTGIIGSLVKIAALLSGGGVTSLFAVDAVTVTINVIGTTFLARRAARRLLPPAEPPGELTREVLRFAAIGSIGLLISIVVFQRAELFFLQHYSNDEQIALYSVPFSIVIVLMMLPRSLNMVIAPTVATLVGAGELGRIRLGFGRAIRVAGALALGATALAFAVGPAFITLLYGPAFEDSGPVLLILLVTLPFVPLMSLAQSLLLGLGRQWVPTAILAGTAVVNIVLALLFIPRYEAIGAAVANSTAQVFAAVTLVAYASACVGGIVLELGKLLRSLVVAALAGGVAFGVVEVLPPVAGPIVATVVFCVVAIPLAALLRVLPSDDAAWLASLLGPRLGSRVRRSVGALWRAPIAWSRNR